SRDPSRSDSRSLSLQTARPLRVAPYYSCFSARKWAHFATCARIALKCHESARKNPYHHVVARPYRGRSVYIPPYSAGRIAGGRGLRVRRVGHLRSGDLSFCRAGFPRRNCVVGSFSEVGSVASAATALDAL